jgi:membrane-associated phospholipid phosphatase
MSGWETGWGLEFLVFMNSLGGSFLDIVLEPFHWIGGEVGYTVILPMLFWSVSDRLGRRLYLLAMFSALVNGIFKIALARPRPYQVDPARIVPAHLESSYGIPSGHAQGGMILGLFFAAESRKKWVKAVLYASILVMGLSRMIFGVHFLQDVLAGWFLGALVYLIFIRVEAKAAGIFESMPTGVCIAISLFPGVAALAAEALVPSVFPVSKSLLATGGALSGILIGLSIEQISGAFRSDGAAWKRIVRAPAGLVILGGLQLGLSTVFYSIVDENQPSFSLFAFYVLRYLTVGFCGYWLVPEIFIRLGLANPRD